MRLTNRLATVVAIAATIAVTSAGSALAAAGGQAKVPAQPFAPLASSFLSASTGYLLGGEHCLPGRSCKLKLAVTTDAGAHWQFRSVPRGATTEGVSQVLFATSQVGWLYGGQLWVTRDGGRHWRHLLPAMAVQGMTLAGSRVYAALTPPRDGLTATLYTSPVNASAWTAVHGVTGPFGVLSSFGDTVRFATVAPSAGSPTVIWTRTGGGAWHQRPFSCPGKDYTLSSIAAASTSDVAYLCTNTADYGMTDEGMRVLTSHDGGRTAHLVGRWVPTISGSGGVLAIPPGRFALITFATPPNAIGTLGRSVNGGRSWHAIKKLGYGTWNSLQYVGPTTGFIVADVPPDGPATEVLLRTTNAGRSWLPLPLPAPR